MESHDRVYKGMRVFPPDEYRHLAHIIESWRTAAHSYGYQEYQTPLIDPVDLYTNKTSDEIVREQTYTFVDRGNRAVLLRPEITPGASAMVADLHQKRRLHTPSKLFSIGSVFRYERTQKGRSREHIQFNADLFGEQALWADIDIISLACSALAAAGLASDTIEILINDRSSLEQSLTTLGMDEETRRSVIRLLDRKDKMEPEIFATALQEHTEIPLNNIESALAAEPETVTAVRSALGAVQTVYSPQTVRGFDYYTGIVFEIYLRDRSRMSRSLVGGGRYDNLITSYGSTSAVPAVGFGMGDTVLLDCLATDTPQRQPFIALYAADDNLLADAKETADLLRTVSPTTFLGTVTRNKQSALHKRCVEEGASHIIRADDHGYVIRTTKEKADTTLPSARAIMHFVQDQ